MGVESFGVWLDGELERAKLNRAGLAALVGVTEATVSGWRYGRNAPKARNIQAIARVLTVPVTEVYAALGRIPPDTELSPARRRILEILAGKTAPDRHRGDRRRRHSHGAVQSPFLTSDMRMPSTPVGALGIRMSLKWIARTKTPPPS